MLQVEGLREGLDIFKTLGSDVRMKIVELLADHGTMNLNEIASALELTNGAVTSHIRKMEEAGIIRIDQDYSGKGNQKVCSLQVDQLLVNIRPLAEERNLSVYEAEIQIGDYLGYNVSPGCGLALAEGMAGTEDDPSVFSLPERKDAQMLWFHDGYVEYRIPNHTPEGSLIAQLTLIFEISSADYDSLSCIGFYLDDVSLGRWITFENDASRGYLTPSWYRPLQCQHGFLKMLVINRQGVFLDGVRIAEGPGEEALRGDGNELRFRIETHPSPEGNGGAALFGSAFGNYSQHIVARVHWALAG